MIYNFFLAFNDSVGIKVFSGLDEIARGLNMTKLLPTAAILALLAWSGPVLANPFGSSESSCVAAAEESAKNYEHEQKIIWGKLGGSIQEFKHSHHFNSFKSRCLVDVNFKIAQKGQTVTTRFLVDAFERKIYATFYGVGGAASEVRALTCNYGISFNEAGHCLNETEYESVVAQIVE